MVFQTTDSFGPGIESQGTRTNDHSSFKVGIEDYRDFYRNVKAERTGSELETSQSGQLDFGSSSELMQLYGAENGGTEGNNIAGRYINSQPHRTLVFRPDAQRVEGSSASGDVWNKYDAQSHDPSHEHGHHAHSLDDSNRRDHGDVLPHEGARDGSQGGTDDLNDRYTDLLEKFGEIMKEFQETMKEYLDLLEEMLRGRRGGGGGSGGGRGGDGGGGRGGDGGGGHGGCGGGGGGGDGGYGGGGGDGGYGGGGGDGGYGGGGDGGYGGGGDGGTNPGGDGGTNPGDGTGDTVKTRDGHGDGIPLATKEQVDQAMRRAINGGVSQEFVNDVRGALAKQPKAFLDSFLRDPNSRIVLEPSGGGVGGTFSTDGTITLYEDSKSYITPDELVSAEFVHFWDLGTPGSPGANFSERSDLMSAYNQARRSGLSTGDNSLSDPVEFMMALARHVDGNSNPAIERLFSSLDLSGVEKAFADALKRA